MFSIKSYKAYKLKYCRSIGSRSNQQALHLGHMLATWLLYRETFSMYDRFCTLN